MQSSQRMRQVVAYEVSQAALDIVEQRVNAGSWSKLRITCVLGDIAWSPDVVVECLAQHGPFDVALSGPLLG